MFTGLIRHLGTVAGRESTRIAIACPELARELAVGDSVAVNGVCLTAASCDAQGFTADLLPETVRDTTLGGLKPGALVNLEPALKAGDSLGGHFVQGHVDGTVKLLSKAGAGGGSWLLRFEAPEWLVPLIPPKASIAIDGISLTVQEASAESVSVAIIPATYSATNIHNISPGERVNIEADMLVKAVVHALKALEAGGRPLTEDKLKQLGYTN